MKLKNYGCSGDKRQKTIRAQRSRTTSPIEISYSYSCDNWRTWATSTGSLRTNNVSISYFKRSFRFRTGAPMKKFVLPLLDSGTGFIRLGVRGTRGGYQLLPRDPQPGHLLWGGWEIRRSSFGFWRPTSWTPEVDWKCQGNEGNPDRFPTRTSIQESQFHLIIDGGQGFETGDLLTTKLNPIPTPHLFLSVGAGNIIFSQRTKSDLQSFKNRVDKLEPPLWNLDHLLEAKKKKYCQGY